LLIVAGILGEALANCGNGIREEKEACDDGNLVDGDGCSSDCLTVDANFDCLSKSDDPYLPSYAIDSICLPKEKS
jgi:cysteine-rich repeat protein